MQQRLNKSCSDKTAAAGRGSSSVNANTQNSRKTDLDQLHIQRTVVDENEDDVIEEELEEDMETSETFTVQKKCAECDEDEKVQRSTLKPFIQSKTDDEYDPGNNISKQIQSSRGGGQALPDATKSFMQNRFGTDFSNVRIHTGEYANDLSTQLNAQAFTAGNDIYFNSGKFAPDTVHGKKLLAHELTHTIQQNTNRVNSSPKVQRSFWSFIKKAAGSVWSGIKKVGQWIGGGAKWLWNAVKWVGGQLIDKIAGVLQRFAFWMTQLPIRIYRLLSGLWQGLKTFKPWTLKWWESLGEVDTWKDFLKWLGSRFLEILEIGGIGEAYETIQDFIKFNTRTLSASEVKNAKSVFGNSINLDFVRVDEHAVIGPAFTHRAYTSFHTINSWGGESEDVMIHELSHVWQYQHAGAIYMPQAIHAQAWGAGYDYGGVPELQLRKNAGNGFQSFNREQQAQIIQDFFKLRQTGSVPGVGASAADLPLYAGFAETVSTLNMSQLVTPV